MLFELGKKEQAIREMRALLRRYPEFPDVRAALTAALWNVGKEGDAETNWCGLYALAPSLTCGLSPQAPV